MSTAGDIMIVRTVRVMQIVVDAMIARFDAGNSSLRIDVDMYFAREAYVVMLSTSEKVMIRVFPAKLA